MNYNNYVYNYNDEYKKLNKERLFLENEGRIKYFSFRGPDGKILDKKKYTMNEYEALTEKEKYDLNRYSLDNSWDAKYQKLEKEKAFEIQAFLVAYRREVKQRFLKDFAAENNISYEIALGLLKYTLFNVSSTMDIVGYDLEDFDCYWSELTVDKFMEETYTIYEDTYQKIDNMMKNTLELFKIMGVDK